MILGADGRPQRAQCSVPRRTARRIVRSSFMGPAPAFVAEMRIAARIARARRTTLRAAATRRT